MPITGRKPSECFKRFETHLTELVAATGKLFKKKGSIVRVYFPQFVIQ